MPRNTRVLPDDLDRAVEEPGLARSRLLQEAIRVELRRRRLLDAIDVYLAELMDEVGEPAGEVARARALARRIARRSERAAG